MASCVWSIDSICKQLQNVHHTCLLWEFWFDTSSRISWNFYNLSMASKKECTHTESSWEFSFQLRRAAFLSHKHEIPWFCELPGYSNYCDTLKDGMRLSKTKRGRSSFRQSKIRFSAIRECQSMGSHRAEQRGVQRQILGDGTNNCTMLARSTTTSCNWLVIRRAISFGQSYMFHELTGTLGSSYIVAIFESKITKCCTREETSSGLSTLKRLPSRSKLWINKLLPFLLVKVAKSLLSNSLWLYCRREVRLREMELLRRLSSSNISSTWDRKLSFIWRQSCRSQDSSQRS